MRYSSEHKEETRARIVREASRQFRKRGGEGIGIAELMRELKLTHGGFYRHFNSKENLFAEACASALNEISEKMYAATDEERGRPLKAIIEAYLNMEHCENPADGCPVGTLGPEIPRHPRKVQNAFERGRQGYVERLSRFLPGETEAERRQNFFILFSGMAGALMVARTIGDAEIRLRVLDAAKDFYIEAFCPA